MSEVIQKATGIVEATSNLCKQLIPILLVLGLIPIVIHLWYMTTQYGLWFLIRTYAPYS